MTKAKVKLTPKGVDVMNAMDTMIREVRDALEMMYYRKVCNLQDYRGCDEKLARSIAWMALCELRADLARTEGIDFSREEE